MPHTISVRLERERGRPETETVSDSRRDETTSSLITTERHYRDEMVAASDALVRMQHKRGARHKVASSSGCKMRDARGHNALLASDTIARAEPHRVD